MTLEFTINNQTLRYISTDNHVADSENYLKAHFKFSSDWDGLSRIVYFKRKYDDQHDYYFDYTLDSTNTVTIPWEVLQQEGTIRVGCYGQTTSHGGVNETVITCNYVEVYLSASCLVPGQIPSTPSQGIIGQTYEKIATVYNNLAYITPVGQNITAVTGVYNNLTAINAVNTNATNINTVATNIANVNAVGTNIAAVTNVNSNMSAITTVNTNATNINTVATNISDVVSVGDNIANVNAVAGDLDNIDAASGHAATATTKAAEAAASASAAALSATSAGTSATTATQQALAASASATSATASVALAETAATNASTSATAASGYATTATAKAAEASASATNAATSATNAGNSATAASGSATNAATSEGNALTYKNLALQYKNEAQTIKESIVAPSIDSATNHWYVNGTDTGVNATGPQGPVGPQGEKGDTGNIISGTVATGTTPPTDQYVSYWIDTTDTTGDVVQTTGNSTTNIMSQNAVTEALNGKLSTAPATISTLGGIIVGDGLSVNASGTVSVAEKPLETEFSYRLDSPAKQVVVAEANASMGNILSTDTTIASKIINNVPLSNNMSMILLIPASMKQEIINEVNAGVLVTIYTILDTDTTLARRIINSAPLSSGTFNFLEVNNG